MGGPWRISTVPPPPSAHRRSSMPWTTTRCVCIKTASGRAYAESARHEPSNRRANAYGDSECRLTRENHLRSRTTEASSRGPELGSRPAATWRRDPHLGPRTSRQLVPWRWRRRPRARSSRWRRSMRRAAAFRRVRGLAGRSHRLVAMAHVSNALGTLLPWPHVEAAHRRGVPVLLDGAQAVAHTQVDVRALGCASTVSPVTSCMHYRHRRALRGSSCSTPCPRGREVAT